MRVAAMDDDVDTIETGFKETLIGREFERLRHNADGIGEHAVLRNDGKAFDVTGRRCRFCAAQLVRMPLSNRHWSRKSMRLR